MTPGRPGRVSVENSAKIKKVLDKSMKSCYHADMKQREVKYNDG